MKKNEYMVPLAALLDERKKHKRTKNKLKELRNGYYFKPRQKPIEDIVEYIKELSVFLQYK